MDSVSPVMTEQEVDAEQIIALGQKQYYPIIVCRVSYPSGQVATVTRFRFSDKERELIAKGADLLLSQPHHGSLMPIGLQLAMPDQYPEIDLRPSEPEVT
jgi:hypothetical protein